MQHEQMRSTIPGTKGADHCVRRQHCAFRDGFSTSPLMPHLKQASMTAHRYEPSQEAALQKLNVGLDVLVVFNNEW